MKTFIQHIKESDQGIPSELFDEVIASMISQPGYQGHEIVGDEITFTFDSDDNADVAYSNVEADELVHVEDPYQDLKDMDYEDLEGEDDEDGVYGDYEELDESISDYTRIDEAKIIVKVNSKGQKRRRVKCKRGFKLNPKGSACVPIAGKEKATKKLAIRKSVRTKKSKGAGYKTKVNRKSSRAKKKRKSMGL